MEAFLKLGYFRNLSLLHSFPNAFLTWTPISQQGSTSYYYPSFSMAEKLVINLKSY